MQKKEKGITLIALIVTIIVMLILASITITTLTGKKGLINQATNTTESAQRESIIEKIEADLLKEKTKTGETPTKDKLKEIIEQEGYNKGALEEDSFVTKDGEYTIEYIEIIGWSEDNENPVITLEDQQEDGDLGINIKITDNNELEKLIITNPDNTTLTEEDINNSNHECNLFSYFSKEGYQNGIYTISAQDGNNNISKKQIKIQWLFRANNEYTEITGGWKSNYFYDQYGDIPNITYTKDNGTLSIGATPYSGNGRLGTWYTTNTIDMKDYDYLVDEKYVNPETTSTGKLQVWVGSKTKTRTVSEKKDSGYIITTLDISNINDKQTVVTGCNGLETDYYSMFISKIYMYKILE